MMKLKRNRKNIVLFISLLSIFALSVLSYSIFKQHNKLGSVSKNHITSFKVHNIRLEEKEIKNKSDRNKIIDLINSINITKSPKEIPDGCGYGITITYLNGEKLNVNFPGDTFMSYSTGDNPEGCEVYANTVEDTLKNYYDKN